MPTMKTSPASQQAATPIMDTLEQVLLQAISHHQAGRIEIAEDLYRTILEVQPQHPQANYQLGLLAVQVNQAENGLPHFAAALQAQPEQVRYWLTYIDALIQADEIEIARQFLVLGRQHGLQGDAVEVLAAQLEARK
jgi:predicted Zn-dependent protease